MSLFSSLVTKKVKKTKTEENFKKIRKRGRKKMKGRIFFEEVRDQ